MSFIEFLREDISVPVAVLLGGKGTRMEGLAYNSIVGKKTITPYRF